MNKEENNPNKCPICGRPTHKESKHCIFHASAEEKTEEEFKKALKEYIQEIKEEGKDYDFEGFIFVGNINFKEEFKVNTFKNAGFIKATFRGSADFSGANFKGDAGFSGANFRGSADFSGATFKDSAGFIKATFRGSADFSGATFKDSAGFIKVTFRGETSFLDATFKGDGDFIDTSFMSEDNFWNTTFEGDVSFAMAKLPPGGNLSFKVKHKGNLYFIGTFLENIYLELNLEKEVFIDFTNARFRNTQIEREVINGHILQEQNKDFSEAKEIYLLLKNNFHGIGRYNDESWAFKKEKDMERKSHCHLKSSHKWLWSCFLNGIFGYGEQPGKVIVSAILVILLFASLFTIFGISNVGIEFNTSNNFLDCMYFSTITFTTLGYGDFRPLEGWGRILAGSEAFIGAFMMALFVYTFARRTGGR